jgi:hypothetical protein
MRRIAARAYNIKMQMDNFEITPVYTHTLDFDCVSQSGSFPEDNRLYRYKPDDIIITKDLSDYFLN